MNRKKKTVKKSDRVQAKPRAGLGTARYGQIKAAAKRVAQAHEAGYFIEALMLIESMLSDRIESRLTHLMGGPLDAWVSLGEQLTMLKKHETVGAFRQLIRPLQAWRRQRNVAAHAAAKLHNVGSPSFENRLAAAAAATTEGMQLLVSFANIDADERKLARVQQPATAPDALAPIEHLLGLGGSPPRAASRI